jgi:hypothetical protein
MNIIYKITFHERLENKTPPYYYIGSKSNCNFKDGVIFANDGKEYWGSSRYEGYPGNSSCATAEIIKEVNSEVYNDLIIEEYNVQVKYDAVRSSEYFNLSYATINTFAEPGYAVYMHKDAPNKKIRLKSGDSLIESGEYVHVNSGRIIDKAVVDNWVKKVSSKPKSKEHRKKIGRKDMIMLQNIDTLECRRVNKFSPICSDDKWRNPRKITPEKKHKCRYCDIMTTPSNLNRWHNEKCKFKDTGKYIAPNKVRTTDRKRISVTIDGVQYKSINEASKLLGVSKHEIKKRARIN